jgi:Ca2+:H+ antiporter
MPHSKSGLPTTAWLFPVLAVAFYPVATALGFDKMFVPTAIGFALAIAMVPILFGAVFAAVHHAEVIAHRVGEPYGTLVLTVSVTVIEVALIASVMIADADGSPTLARDTVLAVVMIVVNGLSGLCILVGGFRFREQSFRVTGASAYVAVLAVLSTLTLILPNFTRSAPGPVYSSGQLGFVGVMTLILYAAFLYIQTVRHREYFIVRGVDDEETDDHVPTGREVAVSAGLLLAALVGVVLLSKKFAVVVEAGRVALGAPAAVTGLIVAVLILLPEGMAAVQAARRNELQKSLNLALGSSLATIGMTFPAVALVALVLGKSVTLGIDPVDEVLLGLTLLVSVLTFGTGRSNILFGFVHLVIFATYLFLTFAP